MASNDFPEPGGEAAPFAGAPEILSGFLHILVAFDWGEAIDLTHAGRLLEPNAVDESNHGHASHLHGTLPCLIELNPLTVAIPALGNVKATSKASVFDFGAVSVALSIPFTLSAAALSGLAGQLTEPNQFMRSARAASEQLHGHLLPAIKKPEWSDLNEEYLVFQLMPGELGPAEPLLSDGAGKWLAGVTLLDPSPLSGETIAKALKEHLSYSPNDLFVPNQAAAVVVDRECEQTLEAIEFANAQLLKFRHVDYHLDKSLDSSQTFFRPSIWGRLPFWSNPARSLRALGELKVEATKLFERTGTDLKLLGDQYLAEVHRSVAGRFHLQGWEESIRRKLEMIEGIYHVLSDQADTYRSEFMEIVVIVLIVLELVVAAFTMH
jgi:hypothetical protein